MRRTVLYRIALPALLLPALCAGPSWRVQNDTAATIPAAEFSRIIKDFSEEDGYFRSDNFTSNETSYLFVSKKLRERELANGAYIGVGPEQNFTHISKVRPRIAFIVDIRRQAVIQHLLYKALFHISPTPAEFLSALVSRPTGKETEVRAADSVQRLLDRLESAPPSEQTYRANLVRVKKIIEEDFQFPLDEADQQRLEYVYSAFQRAGLGISFRFSSSYWGGRGAFPTLEDLILQRDQNGNLGNFLASDDDYRFVRDLQERNRIIPVVGDFAGSQALAGVADYLRKNGYTVRAFYTSNVEQYLFRNGVFPRFVENVRKLPIDDSSVLIRSVSQRGAAHPASIPGHRNVVLLQKISVFLKDFDSGGIADYWDLVTTHYIAGTP